jgi:hypothetical protein
MKPLTELLEELKAKAEALADALNHESELEDDRAAIKADAIVRIMKRDSLAATPAEKIVETDEQYFKHRAAQRASVVARFRADAEYEAAKAAATQASLITPSMIELQTKITGLEKDLKLSKRETDLREIALRRANGYLADRIREVDNLTECNRRLSAKLEVEPRKDPFGTLEQSRDSLTAGSGGPLSAFVSDPRD